MATSLSTLINNLSEGIHRIKFKFKQDDKKCETHGIKYKYCNCFLKILKMILWNTKVCVTIKIINKSLMKS